MTDRDAGYREGIEAAAKVHVGVDCGGKDTACLTFRKGATVFNFFGAEAEIIAEALKQAALPLPSTPDDGKAQPVAYLRDISGTDEYEALVVCIKGDPGAFPVFATSPASDGAIREAMDRKIKFDECETAEPTLRSMILTYYMQGLQPNSDLAKQYAVRFINALSAHAGDAAKSGGGYIDDVERSFDETPLADKMNPGPPDTHAEVKG